MICIEKYIPKFLDILYDEGILNNVSLTEIKYDNTLKLNIFDRYTISDVK